MKNIHFGTDGIRGTATQPPFTKEYLLPLGMAIAEWALQKYNQRPTILLAHDTRKSCSEIKKWLIQGLLLRHASVTDAQILPSPAVLQLMQQPNMFHCGIIISASHNAYTDNGIKLLDAKTGKLTTKDEQFIENAFAKQVAQNHVTTQMPFHSSNLWTEAHTIYANNIISLFPHNFLSKKKIVLDCANGATHHIAPTIFRSLGAEVTAIADKPNGTNINHECGALHTNFLQETVIKINADIGFAFDGDGDRVLAVNHDGILKDGDDLICLLLQHPEFIHETEIVGTIMTNQGFVNHLKATHKALIRTKVGDKYVAAQLEDKRLLIGGETSGHIIIKNYLNTGDATFVALKILESIIHNNNWQMETFTKMPLVLINVPVTQKKALDIEPCVSIIAEYEKQLQGGRLVIRYSGTENLLRVMVEDIEQDAANTIAHGLANALQTVINK